MYEATFGVADAGAYTDATASTGCQITLWCNDHSDLLYVTGRGTESVRAQVREDVGIAELLEDGEEVVIVTESCLKHRETTIERYLEPHGCMLVPPLRYENGVKYGRILALTPDALTGVYRDLLDDDLEVEVHSKREVTVPKGSSPLLAPETLFPDLTGRQRSALLAAFELGYYEMPRETTTADIGDELGVQRRTAEDHLRRAERKLIEAICPYLK